MEQKIQNLINNLKKQSLSGIMGQASPDEKVNVWFVIAKLQETLLEEKWNQICGSCVRKGVDFCLCR